MSSRYYYLNTHRPYKEKDGLFSFKLEDRGNILDYLHSLENSKWVLCKKEFRGNFRKKKLFFISIPASGIYAIVVTNKKNKISDVAYIGSSSDLHRRFATHSALTFLVRKLNPNFEVDIYYNIVEKKHRFIESIAITKFKPFLTPEKPEKIRISI